MLRHEFGSSALVVMLLAMAPPQTFAGTTCSEPVPAPRFVVGEKWTWRGERGEETTDEVIHVEGETTEIKWTNGDIAFLDKDRVLRKVLRKNGEVITTQGAGAYTTVGQKVLDFPLQIGKKWEYSYFANASSGRYPMLTYYQRYEVVSCEEVTTPAGKFSTFKVRVDQNTVGISMTGTYYFWYAPEVKQSVKRQYVPSRYWSKTFDLELINYERK